MRASEATVRMAARAAAPVACLVALAMATGCSHVVTHTTPYFKDGPWQLEPPQGELKEGTHVLVVGKEGTYSRIWSIEAFDVYVWDGALKSIWNAPAARKSKPEAKPRPAE